MSLDIVSPDKDFQLAFKDVLNYTSPCTLAAFLKQWKTAEQKGTFPHE